MRPFLPAAVCLGLALNSCASAPLLSPSSYRSNGYTLDFELVPDSPTIMVGEPTWVTLRVGNPSDKDLRIGLWHGVSAIDAEGRFRGGISILDQEGQPVPPNLPFHYAVRGFGGSGPTWPLIAPTKGAFEDRIFLPSLIRFVAPGTYTIVFRRKFPEPERASSPLMIGTGADPRSSFDVEVRTTLRVIPADDTQMGKRIAALGETALKSAESAVRQPTSGRGFYGEDYRAYSRNALSLSAIDDPRVVPHLLRLFELGVRNGFLHSYDVSESLRRLDYPSARARLQELTRDSDPKVKAAAQASLDAFQPPVSESEWREMFPDVKPSAVP